MYNEKNWGAFGSSHPEISEMAYQLVHYDHIFCHCSQLRTYSRMLLLGFVTTFLCRTIIYISTLSLLNLSVMHYLRFLFREIFSNCRLKYNVS
jgi:hypothetical protein